MGHPQPTTMRSARVRAKQTPLDLFDVSHWDLLQHDTIGPYFERLRAEDPIRHCRRSPNGPYWSVTRYEDVRRVEIDHQVGSSEGNVTLVDQPADFQAPMFIAMDPPVHDAQRRVVQPSVATRNLRHLEPTIRERAARILDDLPPTRHSTGSSMFPSS